VTARALANIYAQTLGSVFTTDPKPLEVELAVAGVGGSQDADEIYRISYDGSVADVPGYVAMGGQADSIAQGLGERWREGLTVSEALRLAVELLGRDSAGNTTALGPAQLEVAVLDRQRPRRAFRRLAGPLLERLLEPDGPASDVPRTDDPRPGLHDTLTGEGGQQPPTA
jgi:proteasome alpha subunit